MDKHGGNNGVESYLSVGGDDGVEESAEASKEVTASGNDEGEDGADDGTATDGALVTDGIELAYHLGQAHGAEGGEDNNT